MSNFCEQYEELVKVNNKSRQDLNELISKNKEEFYTTIAKKHIKDIGVESISDFVDLVYDVAVDIEPVSVYSYYNEDMRDTIPNIEIFKNMIDYLGRTR